MGSSAKPRFAPELFRTADEIFGQAQGALGPAFQRAIELQQRYGIPLAEAYTATARAAAPERTAFALDELSAAQEGRLAPGQERAFQQAFRGAVTARGGSLAGLQPGAAFDEALGTAELLRGRQLQALSLLPEGQAADLFSRSAPDIGTAISLEQQRGANIHAALNARGQAKSAGLQRNLQLGIAGGALALAPFTGGATLPLAFGALGGSGGFGIPQSPLGFGGGGFAFTNPFGGPAGNAFGGVGASPYGPAQAIPGFAQAV